MKFVFWLFGALIFVGVLFIGLERLASERIEVIELLTLDENGEEVTTRLWIVDDEGLQYLRVGSDGSSWFSRLQENGEFRVTRDEDSAIYSAVLREDKSSRINDLMQSKYTWGDSLIGYMIGSREGSIPIELHRVGQ